MEKEYVCCICGKRFKGYGNNPWPVKKSDKRCCDKCNEKVITARINKIFESL